jgi:ankyrin repeat protein
VFVAAAASGHATLLNWLLGFPSINVNDRNQDGSTAAIIAVGHGSMDCVRLLLNDRRADFDLVNLWGISALSAAVARYSLDLVRLLVRSGRIDMRISGGRALAVAFQMLDGQIRDILFTHRNTDVNTCGIFGPRTILMRGRGMMSHMASTVSSALVEAIRKREPKAVAAILRHRTLRMTRDDLTEAIFESIRFGCSDPFAGPIGANLAMRDRSGDSLLAVAIVRNDQKLTAQIQSNPKFDLAQQEPARCIVAVVEHESRAGLEALAAVPGIDLNMPLPHGLHGFPDLFSRSNAKRVPSLLTPRVPGEHDVVLQEGVPMLWATPSNFLRTVLLSSQIDPNQRGKYGETIFFRFTVVKSFDCPGCDVNATDRHGNTVATCAILSGFESRLPALGNKKWHFCAQNENSDTWANIAQDRSRRRSGGVTPRPKVREPNPWYM